MQYNNTISLITNEYNEFAEAIQLTATNLRCCIMEMVKAGKSENKGHQKNYDMKIITSNKTFAPYSSIFPDDTIIFQYNSVRYEPVAIRAISGFSGKVKYYEIQLRQVKDGAEV